MPVLTEPVVVGQKQPFGLPNIDRPIDNTALTAYMTCPREYFYGMVEHRRGKGRSPSLVFGAGWHKAMEHHYKGKERSAVQQATILAWEGHDAQDDPRTLDRLLVEFDKYTKLYGSDPATETGRTIGWPDRPLVEVSTNAMGRGLLHPYAGKIDRFIEIHGLYYVEDHKTTMRKDKNYFPQFTLSNQMMGYVYLAGELMPDKRITGVRINLLHLLTNKSEFERQTFPYDQDKIGEWIDNTNGWLLRMDADYDKYNQLVKEHGSPLPPNILDQAFPGHYGENGCTRKYGMCAYHTVCQIGPKLRNKALEQYFDIKPWNPLEVEDE